MADRSMIPTQPLVFRLSEKGPGLIRRVLESKGWIDSDEATEGAVNNLCWRSCRFKPSEYASVSPFARLNHFPKSSCITKKDSLYRNLRKLRAVHGSIFNFFPHTFVLPTEYTRFVNYYSEQEEKAIWICKPPDLSRGRKIFLFRELGDLTYDCQILVQKYVQDPLLVSGYKFDLRLYVLVTSFHPLQVFIYKDGLVRFGTHKYDTDELDDLYSHLTNYSINKFSPHLNTDKDGVGPGCKWTFFQLRKYWEKHGIDAGMLWERIKNLCILTALTCAPVMPPHASASCFELFGFDVIVDSNMKPWLLEVNTSPALGTDSEVDTMVKEPLISDMVGVLDFEKVARDQAEEMEKLCREKATRKRLSTYLNETKKERVIPDLTGQRNWNHCRRVCTGNFEAIFPFNDASAAAGARMCYETPNCVQSNFKTIVQEVKTRELAAIQPLREKAAAERAARNALREKERLEQLEQPL